MYFYTNYRIVQHGLTRTVTIMELCDKRFWLLDCIYSWLPKQREKYDSIPILLTNKRLYLGTLLNLLFGTQFVVMDSSLGRNQTTKGVWLGKSTTAGADLLILDVEGTDGRERGEEQKVRRTVCLRKH